MTTAEGDAWTADLGDGRYRNPVLCSDFSDPDAIRVGDDYYLVSSTFNQVPGLPVLHSRDLVNWTILGHVLTELPPAERYREPRPGQGVWAPSLRHHAGRFWVCWGDPDVGIFLASASDPAGPWTRPHLLVAGTGLIDPCPFWDEDGTAYVVHGWAPSRSGIRNRLTLRAMAPDGSRLLDDPDAATGVTPETTARTPPGGLLLIDGDQVPGCHTLEGPKLYRRGDHYYVFAPAGGVAEGWQSVFRSRRLTGPYEHRVVLSQGGSEVNGPHQGAWVDTPGGQHWFLHFQDRGAYGRITHLQPLRWTDDDWPVIGAAAPGAERGEPVPVHPRPHLPSQPRRAPQTTDEFTGPALGPQWAWPANPRRDWCSLTARPGWLRLPSQPTHEPEHLGTAAAVLSQRFPALAFTARTEVEFRPRAVGERTGLAVLGERYAWIGLHHTEDGTDLVLRLHLGGDDHERDLLRTPLPAGVRRVGLAVRVRPEARCQFHVHLGGEGWREVGEEFTARPGRWVGARLGVFALAPAHATATGHADLPFFRVGPG
ncbi:glycoside hydrolase family 43 protein [Actinoalloteichus spitiensis]|uniref:glycoside hydrolase family 43 protein n=1 Tax=Actinoalloteichus spitiensis TaxID=252394 RepID=UPI0012F698E2|nr:glycoside hydrolase 43 family protein [Actinoalloteichus spitiensis]